MDFRRRARSQPERTRREDRRLKFYALRDNLTGDVQPLAGGIALKYHTPGCGLGNRVALTRHLGTDQAGTEVLLADARRGQILRRLRTRGQVTSAVPVGRGVIGAMGTQLVRLGENRHRRVARAGGLAYMLRATRTGVDMLVLRGPQRAEVRNLRRGRVSRVGFGARRDLTLYQGAGGRNVVVGASKVLTRRLRRARDVRGATVRGASLRGGVILAEPPGGRAHRARVRSSAPDNTVPVEPRLVRARDGRVVGVPLPEPLTDAYTRLPSSSGVRARSAANTTTPKCAVPRNDLRRQVPQPNADQVRWAIEQATRNNLQGGVLTRPSNYANMGLNSYQPSLDFTRGTLAGSASSVAVPPSVIEAVFAQESAWKQASFRALPGVSGNPLVADYYGAGGTLDRIDYDLADCGYGLSQVTDPMTASSTRYSANGKAKVAVDYAENTAAGITFLVEKWNQLYNAGITLNNADPSILENWYFAVWAYNSGFHPYAAGQPWGLGWTNNPMNADYPPNRQPFLRTTYADAEHPGDWPYQERIFGWMETPMLDYRGNPAYPPPINAADPSASSRLQIPGYTRFCTLSNECSPSYRDPVDPNKSYCLRSDRKCWWHEPVTFANCPTQCAASRYTYSGGATEPAGDNNYAPSCDSSLDPDAVIVDDQSTNLNVEGCSGENWQSQGSFSVTYGKNSANTPLGVIDWHQLGTGFGGHTWFTKNRSSGDTSHVNIGTWTPPDLNGVHNIKAHIPANGASTNFATYTIHRGDGTTAAVTIDQHLHENRWISLGNFTLEPGAKVVLTNATSETPGTKNVAFDAVAFTQVRGTPVRRTLDAITTFDTNQRLDTGLPDEVINDQVFRFKPFNNMQNIYNWANGLTSAVTSKLPCVVLQDRNCVSTRTRDAYVRWRNRVLAAGASHQTPEPSDTQAKWLKYATPDPPVTLTQSFVDNPDNWKVRARLEVEFYQENGVIDPDSLTVKSEFLSGNSYLPDFVREIMIAYRDDYGVALPNLTYSAVDLRTYTHNTTQLNPATNGGRTYGRALKHYVSEPDVLDGGSCLRVKSISGGIIGLKPMTRNAAVRAAADNWRSRVQAVVNNGKAPQALADGAREIYNQFFKKTDMPVPPVDGNSPFHVAPPIWLQQDAKVCASGTVSPGGASLTDSSYMPDLYIYVNNQRVGLDGQPTSGPAQRGDFANFAHAPSDVLPEPIGDADNPWDACTFDPENPYFRNRRNGSPYPLQFMTSGPDVDESPSVVRFCDGQYYPPDYHHDP